MQTTRWAMVGTGLMLELIGRDLALAENVDFRVIVSRTVERANVAAAKFEIPEASGDFEAVLRRDDIDVVYVATPHSEHFEQAKAALEAGKHVVVEKSMTTSAAHTAELCAIAQAHGLFAMEAMWTAFNPAIIEIRRRIADGQIGEVLHVHANFSMANPYDADHRLWSKSLAGGSTLDQGVYPISLAHMILGAPSKITASGTVLHGVDSEVATTLDYPSGPRATLLSGLRAFSPLSAFIGGTDGHIEIGAPFWGATSFIHRGAQAPSQAKFSYEREGAGYVPMIRAVSQSILDGKTQHELRTHAETIAVARTMDEVLRQVL